MAGGEEPLNRELYRIPGHAGWFSWNAIHAIEKEALPEFFEGRTLSKTPKIYKEYRDFMINKYRESPRRILTFTEIRKLLVGDVNCLTRVYDFLQQWGLINHGILQDADVPGAAPGIVTTSTPPGMLFTSPKIQAATNLSARENVLQPKAPATKDGTTDEWTANETMLLLEGVSKYGENWDRVAQHVGSRTKVQCVKQFVTLPFGDQFLAEDMPSPVSKCLENGSAADTAKPASKKQKVSHSENAKTKAAPQAEALLEEVGVTPFSDASNPLLAQVALMAAMVGPRVAAAAAQAALNVIAEEEPAVSQLLNSEAAELAAAPAKDGSIAEEPGTDERTPTKESGEKAETAQGKPTENLSAAGVRAAVATALAAASVNAKALADQEEREIELLVTELIETQLRKLQSKLEHFEELEHLMEKERLQLEQMREQVFIDRLQLKRQQLQAAIAATPAGTTMAAPPAAASSRPAPSANATL